MMNKKKLVRVLAPIALAAFACLPSFDPKATIKTPAAVKAANSGSSSYARPAYDTEEDAKKAAEDLNVELTGEGSVLLKNKDAALPLAKATEKVTVFGSAAQSLQGATGQINTALKDDGFTVNDTVVTEKIAAGDTAETVVGDYKDVGVVVLKRGGGEGSDLSVKISEEADDATENNGWTHKRLAQDSEGKSYKHYLMLTDEEITMIKLAEAKCSKVVVLLNTSNAMEMYNLQNDDKISAIMFIGRPGQNGIKAIPKLLSGELNPSGKLVDTWDKDFSANPTWYNSIANAQNDAGTNSYILPNGKQASDIGMHGIDYDEDIYLGYRWSETVYEEIRKGNLSYADGKLAKGAGTQEQADAWYKDNVVYPFGSGMSYTTFEMSKPVLNVQSLDSTQVNSSADRVAQVKKITAKVTVTNTGKVAGKQVVEIYSQAPYTSGEIEKSAVTLVGYAKTKLLAAGESQTLSIDIN